MLSLSLANEAVSLFGADVKQAGNVPIFALGEDAWGVVIYPFWRHDAVVEANPELQKLKAGPCPADHPGLRLSSGCTFQPAGPEADLCSRHMVTLKIDVIDETLRF